MQSITLLIFYMRYKIFFLLLCLVANNFLQADEPFRKHRYDSWRVLDMPQDAIVFVGNSITDMHPWIEAFGNNPRVVNRGNSGTISREIIENMDSWLRFKPAKVFLMIGTNDLGWDSTETSIIHNIETIVQRILSESPNTHVYLESILPAKDQRRRSLATIAIVNSGIKQIASNHANVTYIDLFSHLMGILDGQPYSLDQLHLEAWGYKIWCDIIMPYVGLHSQYKRKTKACQQTALLWGSNAMRATYFSMLPTDKNDILFFGDELVKCGEWNELLHNSRIKNRGTGWGYGGNIATTQQMVEVSLNTHNHDNPQTILVYTATEDVCSEKPLALVEKEYIQLLDQIQTLAPNTPIIVLSQIPNTKYNQRVIEFNQWLQAYVDQKNAIHYCDIYSPLCTKANAIQDNYLYGRGYIEVARAIAPWIKDCWVISDDAIDVLLTTK